MTMKKIFQDAVQKGVELFNVLRTGNKFGLSDQDIEHGNALTLLIGESKDAFQKCDDFSKEIFGRTVYNKFLEHLHQTKGGMISWTQVATIIDAACQTVDETAVHGGSLSTNLQNLKDKASLVSEAIHSMDPHLLAYLDEHLSEQTNAVLLSFVQSMPRADLMIKQAGYQAEVQDVVNLKLQGWDVFKDGPKN